MKFCNMTYTLSPSLPAASYQEIESLLQALQGVAADVQIDVVDGQFAPMIAWPFTEREPMAALQKLRMHSSEFRIEIDCMIAEPEQYLDAVLDTGAQRVIIHIGSTTKYDELIKRIHDRGALAALALVNDTPLSELDPYIEKVDFVQLMGITEIGQQGQPFDERTLARLVELRAQYPDLDIGVDGAVNESTIVALKEAGANRFAPGSAIAKVADPAAAYKHLASLISV